jgi:hypothetical protein
MMTETITMNVRLVTEECCACGMVFALPSGFQKQRRNDHANFYCPAGHAQHYAAGSADVEKMQSEIERLRKLYKAEQKYAADRVEERNAAQRQLRATKAAHTRTKNRIANGVCPCCNRSFQNLHRHMQGQHPDYTKER